MRTEGEYRNQKCAWAELPRSRHSALIARHLVVTCALCALLFTLCPSASAQQTGKIYRIGWLTGGSPRVFSFSKDAVQRELRTLGYVEGKNLVFEHRYAEDDPKRSPALADELVRLNVDIIVAGGGNDTQAAKNSTKTIPIVFLESVADPVAIGLVASLARPGGNITGFTTLATVLAGKRLEFLKEALPKLSRVGVLWNSQAEDNAPPFRRMCWQGRIG